MQKNKAVFFSIVLLVTIAIARFSAFIKPSGITILGLRVHHFEYGIAILILIMIINHFRKIKGETLLVISGLAIGLIIDESFFIIGGMKSVQQYYATLPSTVILALIIVMVILTINARHTKKE